MVTVSFPFRGLGQGVGVRLLEGEVIKDIFTRGAWLKQIQQVARQEVKVILKISVSDNKHCSLGTVQRIKIKSCTINIGQSLASVDSEIQGSLSLRRKRIVPGYGASKK